MGTVWEWESLHVGHKALDLDNTERLKNRKTVVAIKPKHGCLDIKAVLVAPKTLWKVLLQVLRDSEG